VGEFFYEPGVGSGIGRRLTGELAEAADAERAASEVRLCRLTVSKFVLKAPMDSAPVGGCRLTRLKPVLKAPTSMASALEATI